MSPEPDKIGPRSRPVPDWLIDDAASPVGEALRRERVEWVRASSDRTSGESRVAAALLQLQSERPCRPLLARANARALRWVDARLRASRTARSLATLVPGMPWQHRLLLRLNVLTAPAIAAVLLILCRTGLLTALEGVTRFGARLARLHIDRHIWPSA